MTEPPLPPPLRSAFPRPSGRGSIAALRLVSNSVKPCPPSPGHQAGAPLRHDGVGHAAGASAAFPRPSGRGSIAAGCYPVDALDGSAAFPRPSGRGSIAAVGRSARPHRPAYTRFPRPSGRGSIAATRRVARAATRMWSSPGHQAGAPLRPRCVVGTRSATETSPGHQAGAPLRHQSMRVRRLGLAWSSPGHQAGAPLRPPSPLRTLRPPPSSPGHQAGAPLRR